MKNKNKTKIDMFTTFLTILLQQILNNKLLQTIIDDKKKMILVMDSN